MTGKREVYVTKRLVEQVKYEKTFGGYWQFPKREVRYVEQDVSLTGVMLDEEGFVSGYTCEPIFKDAHVGFIYKSDLITDLYLDNSYKCAVVQVGNDIVFATAWEYAYRLAGTGIILTKGDNNDL